MQQLYQYFSIHLNYVALYLLTSGKNKQKQWRIITFQNCGTKPENEIIVIFAKKLSSFSCY